MQKQRKHTGFAWIEVLVIAAIILVVVSLFVRVRYGDAWLTAEYSFAESLGISRSVYDFVKVALLFVVFLCYAIYRLIRAKRRP
jgi:hypothetical protein